MQHVFSYSPITANHDDIRGVTAGSRFTESTEFPQKLLKPLSAFSGEPAPGIQIGGGPFFARTLVTLKQI